MHHHHTSSQSGYHCCTSAKHTSLLFSLPSRLKCVSFFHYVHNNRKEFDFVRKILFSPLCSFKRFNFVSFLVDFIHNRIGKCWSSYVAKGCIQIEWLNLNFSFSRLRTFQHGQLQQLWKAKIICKYERIHSNSCPRISLKTCKYKMSSGCKKVLLQLNHEELPGAVERSQKSFWIRF